jgi:hypothetical protein
MAAIAQPESFAMPGEAGVRVLDQDEMRSIFTGPSVWRERFEHPPEPVVAVPFEPEAEAVLDGRARVAEELSARGLPKKARRYESCARQGTPKVCVRDPFKHRFFERFRCGVWPCPYCAPFERLRLKRKYLPVVLKVLAESVGDLSEFVLARVTFTIRSTGEVPNPREVRAMNLCVKRVLRRALGRRKFGLLFRDEFGFELRGHTVDRVAGGLNVHLHGLYLGPFLPWERIRDLWIEETERVFGEPSRGFWISPIPGWRANPEEAARHALNHMLKYTGKSPAVSPERIADLISAVHRVRQVHALGLFFGVKVPAAEKSGAPLCPACKAEGFETHLADEVRLTARGGSMPVLRSVAELLASGYRELPREFEVNGETEELPEPMGLGPP